MSRTTNAERLARVEENVIHTKEAVDRLITKIEAYERGRFMESKKLALLQNNFTALQTDFENHLSHIKSDYKKYVAYGTIILTTVSIIANIIMGLWL